MRKLFSTRCSENSFSIAMLLLRLGIGTLMLIAHGLPKLQNFAEKSARFQDPLNINPTFSFSLLVFAEFFCAAFVILGLFTRLAAIPLIIAMSVALFVTNNGNVLGKGELPAIFLIGFLVILIAGPGRISLDRFIAK